MKNEGVNVRGEIHFLITDKEGNVKDDKQIKNQIQYTGLTGIASRISADNPGNVDGFDYMALGTGSGQVRSATALDNEITSDGGERRGGGDVSVSLETENETNDTIQFQTVWSFTGSLGITEAGIFNNTYAEGGDILAYQDFSVLNVNTGDNLQLTWKIIFS